MRTTRDDAAVIVVGGGPAGASIAASLARAGIGVLVLDRAHFPRAKACSEYLSPEASRLLASMGALDEVERAGAAQLAGMRVRAPDGTWMRGEFAAAHGYRGYRDRGLALPRERLDSILLDCARRAGACVDEGVRVSGVEHDAAGRVVGVHVQARGAPPSLLRTGLVVGADGLRSVVARRLGLARVGRWPRRIALVARYRGVADVGDCGEMHVERDGYVGLADVGGGVTNVAVVVPARRGREIGAAGPDRFVEGWLARRPQLVPRFARAERVSAVLATGPFASHARRGWAPGAALVGDAADFFDPFTGEGIYAALRGSELLATHLLERAGAAALTADSAAARAAVDVALRAYDRARRDEFRGKWIVERIIGGAVASPFLMNRAARALAARRDLADLLVGVTGDFVPAREVLRVGFIARLLAAAVGPATPVASTAP